MAMVEVGSWGRLGAWPHHLRPLPPGPAPDLPRVGGRPGLAYGMGRSYGDVCLNPEGTLWPTRGRNRYIAWDPASGTLTCESGVLLRDIHRLLVPRGWMLPVTPGTQIVTVGGAIANDVHGKNHHAMGSFGDHVLGLQLLRTDGERIDCGPALRPDWFAATVGGLGLTGVILQATLRLRRVQGPWLDAESLPYSGLDEFFDLSDQSEQGWEHTVSWIDCLSGARSRGIFMRGNLSSHPGDAEAPAGRPLKVPFTPPVSPVNRFTLKPFNAAYYHLNRGKHGVRRVHYEPFFYPLDNILEWNRLYGRRGFHQYQCAIPRRTGADAVAALLREIAAAGAGSFLAVLKTFGDRPSAGLLGFPQPGVTLALDFPHRGEATHRLFERLDAVLLEAGGRLYPAKDARMPRRLFEAGYPRLPDFLPFRDPGISSGFSRRTLGS